MRTTEQIDGLESLSIDSFKFLVVPRIVACVIVLPILTLFMDFSGLVGGFLAEYVASKISLHLYVVRNLKETLSNANDATANLADDTEALKHNFLVRGFFRSRGYYSLTDISPDRYRTDKLFMNPQIAAPGSPRRARFGCAKTGLKSFHRRAGSRWMQLWRSLAIRLWMVQSSSKDMR
jgi:hypothetical protein